MKNACDTHYLINPVQTLSAPHLPSFIRLVDYLVINSVQTLVASSVAKLLAVFEERVSQTPSNAVIQSWSRSSEGDPSEEHMSQKVGDCFSILIGLFTVKPWQYISSGFFQVHPYQCSVWVGVCLCVLVGNSLQPACVHL